MNTKFETGATTHAVNDLILLTDTTRELAELRDTIYKRMVYYTGGLDLTTKFFSDWNKLHLEAKKEYKRIFPNEEDHMHLI